MAADKKTLLALPNIGERAADLLVRVGISNPDELRRVGSVEAVYRIRTKLRRRSPCRSMLSAVEGAIRGVRWHRISKRVRDRLWEKFQLRLHGK